MHMQPEALAGWVWHCGPGCQWVGPGAARGRVPRVSCIFHSAVNEVLAPHTVTHARPHVAGGAASATVTVLLASSLEELPKQTLNEMFFGDSI